MSTFRIGAWRVEPDRLRLTGAHGSMRIRKKDMALLALLAEGAPGVVPREQIMGRIWPRTVVPNVLPVAVARLREAFGDAAVIENVRGLGYRLAVAVTPDLGVPAGAAQPYRGLESFEFEDAALFFGRQAATREILAAVARRQQDGCAFVLVLGASGSGKSSLLRAGVLPAIVGADPLHWHHALIDCEEGDPFARLAVWLQEEVEPGEAGTEAAATEFAVTSRAEPARAAGEIVARLRAAGSGQRLVLLFDHLETLFDDASFQQREREAVMRLMQALAESGCVTVLGAMRSDCFVRMAESETLLALTRGYGLYQLGPPTPAETSAIIERPALAVGLHFELSPDDGTRLSAQLLADTAGEPDVLPLLQYVLAELSTRRSPEGTLRFGDYRALGGLAGCLAQRAEQIFATLPARAQRAFTGVLVSLARPTAEGFARRSRLLADFPDPDSRSAIGAFVDARLLVTALSDSGATIAVTHDSLFRNWPRAVELLKQRRHQLAVVERLSAAARHWESERRSDAFCMAPGPLAEALELQHAPEIALATLEQAYLRASVGRQRHGQRLRRAGIAALGVLSLAFGAAALVGFKERARAETEASLSQGKSTFLVSLFSQGDPGLVGRSELTARAMLDAAALRLRSELATDPQTQAAVMHTIGLAYMNIGAFGAARPLLEDALRQREGPGTRESVALVESLNGLGKLAYYENRHEEAKAHYSRALAVATRVIGADHAETAQTLNNLGELHLALAQHAQALDLHTRALETRRRLYGDDHGQVAISWHNLAGVNRQLGQLVEAEALYRRAISIQERFYGEHHLETAMGLSNLALLLTERGNYQEAAALHGRALAIRRAILHREHPHLAHSLHNLGALLVNLERFEEAEPVLQSSIDAHLAIFGARHLAVAAGRNNLATSLAARGALVDADAMARTALEGFVALFGPAHPNVAFVQSNLADLLNRQRRFAEAEAIATPALATVTATLKKGHWRIAVAQSVVGEALSAQGKAVDADEYLVAAHATIASALGAHSRGARRAAERAREHFKRRGDVERVARFATLALAEDQR